MMKNVAGRPMTTTEIRTLKRKVKRFETLMYEAGRLSQEISSYADCYSPLQDDMGAVVRRCAEFVKSGVNITAAHAVDSACSVLISLQSTIGKEQR